MPDPLQAMASASLLSLDGKAEGWVGSACCAFHTTNPILQLQDLRLEFFFYTPPSQLSLGKKPLKNRERKAPFVHGGLLSVKYMLKSLVALSNIET